MEEDGDRKCCWRWRLGAPPTRSRALALLGQCRAAAFLAVPLPTAASRLPLTQGPAARPQGSHHTKRGRWCQRALGTRLRSLGAPT